MAKNELRHRLNEALLLESGVTANVQLLLTNTQLLSFAFQPPTIHLMLLEWLQMPLNICQLM